MLTPPTDEHASDEEVDDDDIGYEGNIELPRDIARNVEIHWRPVYLDSDTMRKPTHHQNLMPRNGTNLFLYKLDFGFSWSLCGYLFELQHKLERSVE